MLCWGAALLATTLCSHGSTGSTSTEQDWAPCTSGQRAVLGKCMLRVTPPLMLLLASSWGSFGVEKARPAGRGRGNARVAHRPPCSVTCDRGGSVTCDGGEVQGSPFPGAEQRGGRHGACQSRGQRLGPLWDPRRVGRGASGASLKAREWIGHAV